MNKIILLILCLCLIALTTARRVQQPKCKQVSKCMRRFIASYSRKFVKTLKLKGGRACARRRFTRAGRACVRHSNCRVTCSKRRCAPRSYRRGAYHCRKYRNCTTKCVRKTKRCSAKTYKKGCYTCRRYRNCRTRCVRRHCRARKYRKGKYVCYRRRNCTTKCVKVVTGKTCKARKFKRGRANCVRYTNCKTRCVTPPRKCKARKYRRGKYICTRYSNCRVRCVKRTCRARRFRKGKYICTTYRNCSTKCVKRVKLCRARTYKVGNRVCRRYRNCKVRCKTNVYLKPFSCHARGDPHMKPVKGRKFNDYRAGWHTFYAKGSVSIRYFSTSTQKWKNQRVMSQIYAKCGKTIHHLKTLSGAPIKKVIKCNGLTVSITEGRSGKNAYFNMYLSGKGSLRGAHGTCIHRNKGKIPHRCRSWTFIKKFCGVHFNTASAKCRRHKDCIVDTCAGLKKRVCAIRRYRNGNKLCTRHRNCSSTCKVVARPGRVFRCQATGDPHMRAVSGKLFNDYRAGWHTFYKQGSVSIRYHNVNTRTWRSKKVMNVIVAKCGGRTYTFKTKSSRRAINRNVNCNGLNLRITEGRRRRDAYLNMYLSGRSTFTNSHGTCIHRNSKKIIRAGTSWVHIRRVCGRHFRLAYRLCRKRKACILDRCVGLKRRPIKPVVAKGRFFRCQSTGDPHVTPVNGRKFDDYRAGWHTFYKQGSVSIRYHNVNTRTWGHKKIMNVIVAKCGRKTHTIRAGRGGCNIKCNGLSLRITQGRSRRREYYLNMYLSGRSTFRNAHGTCVHRNKTKITRRHRSWAFIRRVCGRHFNSARRVCRSRKSCIVDRCAGLNRRRTVRVVRHVRRRRRRRRRRLFRRIKRAFRRRRRRRRRRRFRIRIRRRRRRRRRRRW